MGLALCLRCSAHDAGRKYARYHAAAGILRCCSKELSMARKFLEITFVLIVIYLVLSRAGAFSTALRSLTGAYVGAVAVLQGR